LAGQESLRAAAARDKEFVGVDIAAMAQLIHQLSSASGAISAWLRTNGTLPPSVPRTGLRQVSAVNTWVSGQSGMLIRRRNYAVTHLSRGGHDMPRVGAGRLGRSPHRTTAAGAGHRVGDFPDVHTAIRAGAADAAKIRKAETSHQAVPAEVWRHLAAGADDPDYTHGLYDRLGPAGTAGLIAAARGDRDHLGAVRTSLGVASHHLTMNEKWLREMLDAARRDGARDDAVHLLAQAGLDHRARVALGHLGLLEIVHAGTGQEGMVMPAADDPHAAAELYSRHPEALHQALREAPRSAALERLVGQATTARDADPATVRANAERLAGFLGPRGTGTLG
jgi:hypothetical protein